LSQSGNGPFLLVSLASVNSFGTIPKRSFLVPNCGRHLGYSPDPSTFMTNPDGSGIVQAIGPLKKLANETGQDEEEPCPRFLIVTEFNDTSKVVLKQSDTSSDRQTE
jgi:hypothetical protein